MKQSNTSFIHVGLDIGANEIVAAKQTCSDSPPRTFDNNQEGFRKLAAFLRRGRGDRFIRVCMEATGAYSSALACFLHELPEFQVMIANPRRVKAYMKARGTRAKTDSIDAIGILGYVKSIDFIQWQPPRNVVVMARELSRRILDLKTLLGRETNRIQQLRRLPGDNSLSIESAQRCMMFFKQEIDLLASQVSQMIDADQNMKRDATLLQTIPGFAAKSVTKLIPELSAVAPGLTANQWVAHAGIDPRTFESGSSVNRHRFITKQGNRFIREALYMPAMIACRRDPHIRAYYESLVARGKRKKVAMVAVMRKLLVTIHAILKTGKPFDGAIFNPHAKITVR